MDSGPVVAMCWEGEGVVKTGRVMLGETNPRDSKPGTIRGDYCIQVSKRRSNMRVRNSFSVQFHLSRIEKLKFSQDCSLTVMFEGNLIKKNIKVFGRRRGLIKDR